MRKVLASVIAGIVLTTGAMVAPSSAGAASAPVFTLAKSQYFSATPRVGSSTCQNRYVTLPKLSTGYYWSWSEIFAGIDNGRWVQKDLTLPAGTWYWTVCVAQFTNSYYNYQEYSVITLDNSACQLNGQCITHTSAYHRFQLDNPGTFQWGSQIWQTTI